MEATLFELCFILNMTAGSFSSSQIDKFPWTTQTFNDAFFWSKMSAIFGKNVRKHCLHACTFLRVRITPSLIISVWGMAIAYIFGISPFRKCRIFYIMVFDRGGPSHVRAFLHAVVFPSIRLLVVILKKQEAELKVSRSPIKVLMHTIVQ
jgi:hypothetical protein